MPRERVERESRASRGPGALEPALLRELSEPHEEPDRGDRGREHEGPDGQLEEESSDHFGFSLPPTYRQGPRKTLVRLPQVPDGAADKGNMAAKSATKGQRVYRLESLVVVDRSTGEMFACSTDGEAVALFQRLTYAAAIVAGMLGSRLNRGPRTPSPIDRTNARLIPGFEGSTL